MRSFINRIKNSEFLTFGEVLNLKVTIVNVFLILFVFLSVYISGVNALEWNVDILLPLMAGLLLTLTFLLIAFNLSRIAMHTTILSIILLIIYYAAGSSYFFTYILFFVALTIIIFYQDIVTYLLYGGLVVGGGVFYVYQEGSSLIGSNSISSVDGSMLSSMTYLVILVGFYLVFFIQFLVSDNIYERLHKEWLHMNDLLEKYQNYTFSHIKEREEKNGEEPTHKNAVFQKAVSELACFINEFFEDDDGDMAEVVEFYFFLHDQEIDKVIKDTNLPLLTRKYAFELDKYLLDHRNELTSILYDFSTLFYETKNYKSDRYDYNIDSLYKNRANKILSLAILYKFLKSEITQFDKWGQVTETLSHDEITELLVSPEFRGFLSYEMVNFYLDNQELFDKHL